MGDRTAGQGVVCLYRGVLCRQDVHVCCAPGVVPREDRRQLSDAGVVRVDQTAQEGRVDVAGVAAVAVAAGYDSGVTKSGSVIVGLENRWGWTYTPVLLQCQKSR